MFQARLPFHSGSYSGILQGAASFSAADQGRLWGTSGRSFWHGEVIADAGSHQSLRCRCLQQPDHEHIGPDYLGKCTGHDWSEIGEEKQRKLCASWRYLTVILFSINMDIKYSHLRLSKSIIFKYYNILSMASAHVCQVHDCSIS